jgi:hypothetical protein
MATDIDTRFLVDMPANVIVREHDIAVDSLPTAHFDLVHARALLQHVPKREHALSRMIDATKIGGWLLIEDVDWLVFDSQELPEPFATLHRTVRTAYTANAGYDGEWGRRMLATMRSLGLEDVDSRGTFVSRTYAHLFGAVCAFILIETGLFKSGLADKIAQALLGISWLVVLGGFVLVSWLASRTAHLAKSKAAQYGALSAYVVAESILFVPLLWIANNVAPGAITSAAAVTFVAFAALTAFASRTSATTTLVSLTSRTADSEQGTGHSWSLSRKIRSLLRARNGLGGRFGVCKGLLDRGFFFGGGRGKSRIDQVYRHGCSQR